MHTQKQIKEALQTSTSVYPDRIICKKNGDIVVKKSYFYHIGTSADLWATRVECALAARGIRVKVTGEDHFAQWPKSSYFVATIHLNDEK